jgi:hypothetical protein
MTGRHTALMRHRVIRYYGNSGEKIAHYAGVLGDCKAKGYNFDRIVLSHDAKAKDLRTGKSIEEIMADLGVKVEVLPRTDDIFRDIDLVRTMLPKCWFDRENTGEGLEGLKQYRKQWDDTRKCSNRTLTTTGLRTRPMPSGSLRLVTLLPTRAQQSAGHPAHTRCSPIV